ncbi:MAG: NUDIX domain-containing protein [Firmicutes bacterium]|nr:NUDIX domain-containing protein [Bacillota bacterium]
MKLLFTSKRQTDLDLSLSTLYRKAYRAIIYQNKKLLMIKSQKFGEVKFPGGGKNKGEKAFDVLKREVLEETGCLIKTKITPFGETLEYAKDYENVFDLFKQKSLYYICKIHNKRFSLALSDYEVEYGYEPIWISIEEAIEINMNVLSNDYIPWKERETLVLEMLLEMRDLIEN